MDPDDLLEVIRNLLEDGLDADMDDPALMYDIIENIHTKFSDLDEWLCTGGTLPSDWHGASED